MSYEIDIHGSPATVNAVSAGESTLDQYEVVNVINVVSGEEPIISVETIDNAIFATDNAVSSVQTNAVANSIFVSGGTDTAFGDHTHNDDYYTKAETYHQSEVYTKAETYPQSDVYTKTETYNQSEVYAKTETYSQSEVYTKLETDDLVDDYIPRTGATQLGTLEVGSSTVRVKIIGSSNDAMQIIADNASGRPYISFWNRDASGNLDRKGYVGYPESANNASRMRLISDQGGVDVDGVIHEGGAVTATGKISGGEIEGTSLDINGAGNVAGTLIISGGGDLKVNNGVFNTGNNNVTLKRNGVERYSIWSSQVHQVRGHNTSTPGLFYIRGSDGGSDVGHMISFYGGTATGNYFMGVRSNTLYVNTAKDFDVDVAGVTYLAMDSAGFWVPAVYNSTNSSQAYVRVDANGRLYRNNSSVAHKNNIEPIDNNLGKQILRNLDLIYYGSDSPHDDDNWRFYGSSAESADQHAPQLCVYEYPEDCGCPWISETTTVREWVKPVQTGGTMENPIVETEGYWRESEKVDAKARKEHACDKGVPVAFNYDGLTSITASVVDEHTTEIEDLQAEVAQLKIELQALRVGNNSN